MLIRVIAILMLSLIGKTSLLAQCNSYSFDLMQSPRISDYKIAVDLDIEKKTAFCTQTLSWKNTSPDTISEIRFYMYLNAFKNMESTFIRGGNGSVFGDDLSNLQEDEWGWIEINDIKSKNGDLNENWNYIQPNDGNEGDETVLSLDLSKPLNPGESIELEMAFTAKMPKIIARAGYGKKDYFLFVHWFPQPGVYEKDIQGKWGWNCHQFFQQTEFYADFGNYEVTMTIPDHLILGASGCKTDEKQNGNGTTTYTYEAYDVIDFAWVVYSDFNEYVDNWNGVDIRLLIPPEHDMLKDRFMTALKQAFEYLSKHVGPYPYPSITMVDPPLHSLKSGLMEYPMLITCGSVYRAPDNIRSIESLVIHEFTHMYFMATLASNEKEEAWVDEGLVTYFEDEIMDFYYGENCSLFDIMGYQSGNAENSRLEYTRLRNPNIGSTARPGWEIKSDYKGLVYSKTATVLQTLKGMVGAQVMDEIIKTYFERWKFKHPRGTDFIAVANEVVKSQKDLRWENGLDWFFNQCLYETKSLDYAVRSVNNFNEFRGRGIFSNGNNLSFSKGQISEDYNVEVIVERVGEMVIPTEVLLLFENGSEKIIEWDGKERLFKIELKSESKIESVHIDPEKKLYLDLDLNNNSFTLKPNHLPTYKYASKAVHWLQSILQFTSSII